MLVINLIDLRIMMFEAIIMLSLTPHLLGVISWSLRVKFFFRIHFTFNLLVPNNFIYISLLVHWILIIWLILLIFKRFVSYTGNGRILLNFSLFLWWIIMKILLKYFVDIIWLFNFRILHIIIILIVVHWFIRPLI